MKIRNGFVSNSSSSSFVVFGFKVKSDPEMICKLLSLSTENIKLDKDDPDYYNDELWDFIYTETRHPNNIEFVIINDDSNEGVIVGKEIAVASSSKDFYLKETSFSTKNLKTMETRLKEVQQEFGIESEIKLFTGMQSC